MGNDLEKEIIEKLKGVLEERGSKMQRCEESGGHDVSYEIGISRIDQRFMVKSGYCNNCGKYVEEGLTGKEFDDYWAEWNRRLNEPVTI
ncbi:MAG: hypothetical protein Q7S56_03760 [Nanoarchaeota archaeon]|nr:hypothetical protein [Nanoarchaeota archaeon]